MRWASAIDLDPELNAAVERAAESVYLGLGRKEPNLVIAFVSSYHAAHYETLPELIHREFEGAVLFGCCASGVIGGGQEIEEGPSLSLTGALLPGVRLRATHFDAAEIPPAHSEQRVWEDTLRLTPSQQPAFILLADPLSFETETLLRGLDRVFPLSPKIGGLASGARQVGGTALYVGQRVHRSGCAVLSMTGNIEVDTIVAQGCRPIADPMFVTAAHDNLILELDGHSPRDVLADVFDRLPPADREAFTKALFLGLALRVDTGQYVPGDFLIRSVLGIDPQSGALWVNERIPDQSVVQFHLRDAATSAHDLERMLSAYAASRPASPDSGALLFSCEGRGENLYRQPDHDSNAFRRLVADLPLGGLFCAGEIGPVHSTTYLHGHTSAFAIFREKK
jgi:small ligand-binding sensory domain FIST